MLNETTVQTPCFDFFFFTLSVRLLFLPDFIIIDTPLLSLFITQQE